MLPSQHTSREVCDWFRSRWRAMNRHLQLWHVVSLLLISISAHRWQMRLWQVSGKSRAGLVTHQSPLLCGKYMLWYTTTIRREREREVRLFLCFIEKHKMAGSGKGHKLVEKIHCMDCHSKQYIIIISSPPKTQRSIWSLDKGRQFYLAHWKIVEDVLSKRDRNPGSQHFSMKWHMSSLTKSFCTTGRETRHSTIDALQAKISKGSISRNAREHVSFYLFGENEKHIAILLLNCFIFQASRSSVNSNIYGVVCTFHYFI